MYAESIVADRIQLAAAELGYVPEYHTTTEVDTFVASMDAAMKPDASGKLYFARNLSPAELRFIENERILCMCDSAYFLTRYAWLTDEATNITRFRFRGAQPILFGVISDLESRGAAIELLIAKARQQYITTLTQLLVLHRSLFHHYTYGVVASADASKSEEMSEKAFFTYDHMPWWLKPKYSRRVEGVPGLLKFDTISSRIRILHGATSAKVKGGQRTGIARGSTPTVYAISEVAHFPNPEQTIEAALFGGVHANPKTLGFLETTFAGDKDWFAKRYKASKELYHKGLSRGQALFFPWPCAREIYPTPTWWKTNKHHIPNTNWTPENCTCGRCSDKVAEQIRKTELFIRSSPLLSIAMGRDWQMPLEQQWYYHFRYTEAERNGTLGTLMQELSCDDIEAMQSSFDNVFGRATIELVSANRERDYDVYGIVGQAIDDQYEPDTDDIDYNRPRVCFNHTTPKGTVYRWELVPLKHDMYCGATGDDSERQGADCKLFVYKPPEPDFEYSIGGDASNGIGRDASVINVNRVGKPGTPDVQAAEFRSHHVNHVELFAFMLPIALYYRDRAREVAGWPKLAVEQIASVGDVCQNELRKLGYPVGRMHLFGRYDGVELKTKTKRVGWFTNSWSRPMLIGHIVHAIRNGWYIPNSPWTIEECRQFEVHYTDGGKEKLEHSSESWDDGIFASAISYFIVHDMDSLAERSKKQVRGLEHQIALPPIDLTPCTGIIFNPNQSRELSIDDVIHTMADYERFRH